MVCHSWRNVSSSLSLVLCLFCRLIENRWALGAVTGPAIGEALAERSQWRWIFWINLPFCAIGFVILPLFAQLKGATPGSMLQKLRNYDWIGFTLLSGSMVGVLLGISWVSKFSSHPPSYLVQERLVRRGLRMSRGY